MHHVKDFVEYNALTVKIEQTRIVEDLIRMKAIIEKFLSELYLSAS